MTKWSQLDVKKISAYCESYYERWGDYPSVRDVFYYFVDVLWTNTTSQYKCLSRWLVEKRLTGEFDWQLLRDGGGRERTTGDYPLLSIPGFFKVQKYLVESSQVGYRLPRWHEQTHLVIVLLEKEADVPPVRRICNELGVDVLYTRGYSGWRKWFELKKELQDEEREIVFVAITDFDPSGEDIVRFSKEALQQLGLKFTMEKALLTKDQIETHKLPHRPEDSKEAAKLQRDPRYKTWPHGLFRVETAAFRAKAPDAFRKAIETAIQKHFNKEIYNQTRETEEERRTTIEDYDINDQLEDVINELDTAIEEQED